MNTTTVIFPNSETSRFANFQTIGASASKLKLGGKDEDDEDGPTVTKKKTAGNSIKELAMSGKYSIRGGRVLPPLVVAWLYENGAEISFLATATGTHRDGTPRGDEKPTLQIGMNMPKKFKGNFELPENMPDDVKEALEGVLGKGFFVNANEALVTWLQGDKNDVSAGTEMTLRMATLMPSTGGKTPIGFIVIEEVG